MCEGETSIKISVCYLIVLTTEKVRELECEGETSVILDIIVTLIILISFSLFLPFPTLA